MFSNELNQTQGVTPDKQKKKNKLVGPPTLISALTVTDIYTWQFQGLQKLYQELLLQHFLFPFQGTIFLQYIHLNNSIQSVSLRTMSKLLLFRQLPHVFTIAMDLFFCFTFYFEVSLVKSSSFPAWASTCTVLLSQPPRVVGLQACTTTNHHGLTLYEGFFIVISMEIGRVTCLACHCSKNLFNQTYSTMLTEMAPLFSKYARQEL